MWNVVLAEDMTSGDEVKDSAPESLFTERTLRDAATLKDDFSFLLSWADFMWLITGGKSAGGLLLQRTQHFTQRYYRPNKASETVF